VCELQLEHGVEREPLQRPQGREGQKGRQPETASQLRRDARLQGAGSHLRREWDRKRGGGWPGVKAGASAAEGNTLEANPRRATGGHSKTSSDSEPGIKPLKGARGGRFESASREPQESRDRETGTDPAGGQSSERASRHAVGRETSRRVVSGADRCASFSWRTTVQAGASAPGSAGASSSVARRREPQESHRGWTRSARRLLVQTRSSGRQVRGTAAWRSVSRRLAERGYHRGRR
jgi:hypothetical protein